MRLLSAILILSMMQSVGVAHGGRTDANGGHNDRKNGGYHYHGGGPPGSDTSTDKPEEPPFYNTGRGAATRTTGRTGARTSGRESSKINSLIEDPARQVPEVVEPPVLTPDPRKAIPKYSIIETVDGVAAKETRILLELLPGAERPDTEQLTDLVTGLKLTGPANVSFFLQRGRYQHISWATAGADGSNPDATQIKFLQDVIDFDILETREEKGRTTANIAIYPVSPFFPTKDEIRELFTDLKIDGVCTVKYFFARTTDMKHPAAEVNVKKHGMEPVIGLYQSTASRK